MSVSLVVLRFEIEDRIPLPEWVRFTSCKDNIIKQKEEKMQEKDEALPPHQDKSNPNIKSTEKNLKERQVGGEDEGRATSPSNVRGSPKSPTSKHVETREEVLNQHHGSREMREMTVETIMFTDSLNNTLKNLEKAKITNDNDTLSPNSDGTPPTPNKPPDPNTDNDRKGKSLTKDLQNKSPAEETQVSKPVGNKNKKSKKMPDSDGPKKSKKPQTNTQDLSSGDGIKDSVNSDPSTPISVMSLPIQETDNRTSATVGSQRSYASIVTGSPLPQTIEVDTKDYRNMSPTERGGILDGKHMTKSPLSKHQSVIPFSSGNPSVELTKGILHLFKENEMTSLDEGVSRSEMLCMLAVPAVMTIHDLLQLAAPLSQGIQLMRIIRDATPNQYMVLFKFKHQKDADEFYTELNGKPFNSIESTICYLVYVSRVECMKAFEGATLPVPGLTELPTCHICLERMDESVDGILTILCNHAFHGNCLDKWGDTSCPVCRYCQTPEPVEDHKCFTCGAQESLWICLICGHVGCGRYSNAHSYRHFEETQHTYAMQLGNQRVWDYAGDNYVHRLVQSKGDGKPIEWDRRDTESAHSEKLDSLQLEYSYLLTNQLESQRIYFEEQMARIEQDALNRMSEVEARSRKTVEERDKMEQCLQTALKEKSGLERKCSQLGGRLSKVAADLKEEKEMNQCLRENQQLWQTKVMELETKYTEDSKKKQGEIDELKEQLRDLMFYLDAQQKIGSTSDDTRQEIQDGQIVIGEAAAASSDGRSSRKGRKKGR
ncbi:BRCA1-associated protein-like [Asterias rubens]|uniref:BRCA1-associated protein-like n=1 Tax=Asterias rubens TaxID=7604 RepID=UPI0014557BB7|nr:BRCA1-associated protein-like [Asterias rubens]